jgi:uncharacterized RDD family membrane protein YckC
MVSDIEWHVARAGFWRRALALFIDLLTIAVPCELLVIALFVPTNGALQSTSGVVFTSCVSVTQVPQGLEPPPPAGSNFATACEASLFGFETARWLVVGRNSQQGNVNVSTWNRYALGPDGKPRQAWSIDWIAFVLFIVYLVALEHRFGVTLGKRILGIRTAERRNPERVGIAVGRAIMRQLAQWIGALPALILQGLLLLSLWLQGAERTGEILGEVMSSGAYLALLVGAILAAFAWLLWIVIDIARKRDPIYDRIAGTMVVPR